jgi:hypothetical protein
MKTELIDIYDQMVRQEHPNLPYYNGDHWAVPYLVSNDGGFGGGVGEALFSKLSNAIKKALELTPLN